MGSVQKHDGQKLDYGRCEEARRTSVLVSLRSTIFFLIKGSCLQKREGRISNREDSVESVYEYKKRKIIKLLPAFEI